MNTKKKALLLIGSPKGKNRSTSESVGNYLLARLQEMGIETEKVFINSSMRSDEAIAGFLSTVESSDILILAFPLYVDSLPSRVVKALELIAENRKSSKDQRLLAISNSGFPEAFHNHTALDICRLFARETGIEWAGGLALGGGEAIGGRPLDEIGGMVRNVKRSLDLSAAALVEGRSVPEEAVNLMAKPFIPRFLYLFMGNMGWKRQAKKNGVRNRIGDRPYY